jgi:hypothetical protein
MKQGYTVYHHLATDSLGDGRNNIAHVLNHPLNNSVGIAYFPGGYMPNLNAAETVAIFKIKPKKLI